MENYLTQKEREEILYIQENIIGDSPPVKDEEVDCLLPEQNVEEEKEKKGSRKRKNEGTSDRAAKREKKTKNEDNENNEDNEDNEDKECNVAENGEDEDNKGSIVKAVTYNQIRDITLERKSVLHWQDTSDYLLLNGFFVRVPVLRTELKSYLLAEISEVTKLEESDVESLEGVAVKYGLRLKIPEVDDLVNAGVQHVSSHGLTEGEFEEYKNHATLPSREHIKDKLATKKIFEKRQGKQ